MHLQDIDAAYIFDDNSDLDASLSALLEVPSLDMAQFDNVNARPASNPFTGGNTNGSQLTVGERFGSNYSLSLLHRSDYGIQDIEIRLDTAEASAILFGVRCSVFESACTSLAYNEIGSWCSCNQILGFIFSMQVCSAGNYGAPPPRARGNLDGLVPDMKQQNIKRQRIDN